MQLNLQSRSRKFKERPALVQLREASDPNRAHLVIGADPNARYTVTVTVGEPWLALTPAEVSA